MGGRPVEPDRATEVVQDEVDALDPEHAAGLLEEVGVCRDGVAEAGRRLGLAEVGQVEGDGPRDAGDRRHRPAPVVGRAGVSVHEQHVIAVLAGA
jgi:hypothetical protein